MRTMQGLAVIFCEERLRDGTYGDLLSVISRATRKIPVVVMVSDMSSDRSYREAVP
jgi:hypothetical protein